MIKENARNYISLRNTILYEMILTGKLEIVKNTILSSLNYIPF